MSEEKKIPAHVAIIMDGNGRWAKEKGLARSAGHRAGIERVKEAVRAAAELGVKVVTFFAFSTENWSRPRKEIDVLMRYLNKFLQSQIKELDKNNMRFLVIGRGQPLPKYLQEKIKEAEAQTRDNTGLAVVLALNYGGRQEIVDAAKRFALKVLKKEADLEELTPENFSGYLYTAGLPEPDLFIRTSGEMRLSNFLLWQLSYAELYFTRKYWPDFRKKDFQEAVKVYQKRERRFGRINAD
jgi:undecaprenyl diphosphate synthase